MDGTDKPRSRRSERGRWIGCFVAGWLAVSACASEEARVAEPTCPVTNRALTETSPTVVWEGFRFRVVDQDALAVARKDPATAINTLEKQGFAAEPCVMRCPVTGAPAQRAFRVTRGGRALYGCTAACVDKIRNDWKSMAERMAGWRPAQVVCPSTGRYLDDVPVDAVVTAEGAGFRWRMMKEAPAMTAEAAFAALAAAGDAAEPISKACPVMGNLVDRTEYYTEGGRRVYVCCRGCIGRVKKRFAEITQKLEQQARTGDPADLKSM